MILLIQINTKYLHLNNYLFSLGDDVIMSYIGGIQFLPVSTANYGQAQLITPFVTQLLLYLPCLYSHREWPWLLNLLSVVFIFIQSFIPIFLSLPLPLPISLPFSLPLPLPLLISLPSPLPLSLPLPLPISLPFPLPLPLPLPLLISLPFPLPLSLHLPLPLHHLFLLILSLRLFSISSCQSFINDWLSPTYLHTPTSGLYYVHAFVSWRCGREFLQYVDHLR